MPKVLSRVGRPGYRWLPVAFDLLTIACIAVAAVENDDAEFEGAYFNRAVGAPAYAGVFERMGTGTVVPWLTGAGLLLIVTTALQLNRHRRQPFGRKQRVEWVARTLAIACILRALIRRETDEPVLTGALDRDPQIVGQANVLLWLVLALALISIAVLTQLPLSARPWSTEGGSGALS